MVEKDLTTASKGGLPALSDETLNRLADLVASRLAGLKTGTLPSQGRDHGFESRMRYHHISSHRGFTPQRTTRNTIRAGRKAEVKLRHMTNEELFKLYDSELLLRLRNPHDLYDHRRISFFIT